MLSGIGAAIVGRFHAAGYHVVIADVNEQAAQAAAIKLGDNAIAMQCDVTCVFGGQLQKRRTDRVRCEASWCSTHVTHPGRISVPKPLLFSFRMSPRCVMPATCKS